jgi:hypothetical protein
LIRGAAPVGVSCQAQRRIAGDAEGPGLCVTGQTLPSARQSHHRSRITASAFTEKNAAPEGLAERANEIVEIALEIEPRNFR